jgi:hypothetical protein
LSISFYISLRGIKTDQTAMNNHPIPSNDRNEGPYQVTGSRFRERKQAAKPTKANWLSA